MLSRRPRLVLASALASTLASAACVGHESKVLGAGAGGVGGTSADAVVGGSASGRPGFGDASQGGSDAGGWGKGGGAGSGWAGTGTGGTNGTPPCDGPPDPIGVPLASTVIGFVGSDGVVRGVDATEVTRSQFAAFRAAVNAWPHLGLCAGAPLAPPFSGACHPDRPMQTTFCNARAYCAWRGLALCAATDWTEACTNAGQTAYPSGATLSTACASATLHDATATGCRGVGSPFEAVYDLVGNVGEWTEECTESRPWEGGGAGGGPPRCRVRGGDHTAATKTDAGTRLDCASDGDVIASADFAPIDTSQGFRCCEPPVCTPGEQRRCYTGPAQTLGIGLCAPGVQVCLADGTSFGPCQGDTVPTAESCATEGDDDCDGLVNETGADCSCTPGTVAPCYSGGASTRGVGDCHAGTQACNATGDGYDACTGEVIPTPETCAAAGDEDCDGEANELGGTSCVCVPGTVAPCYEGPSGTADVGTCKAGVKTCLVSGEGYGACGGQVGPTGEVCGNDLDDDCNGLADEQGPGQPCLGGPGFAMTYSAAHYNSTSALAVDQLGRAIVGGSFYTDLSLDSTPLLAGDGVGEYLAAFDASGTLVWGRTFEGGALAIAAAPGGAFVVGRSQSAGFPARVSRVSSSGADIWTRGILASGVVAPTAVAATPDGGAVAAFTFSGQLTLGTATFEGSALFTDALVARFSSTGEPVWGQRLRGVAEGGVRVGVDGAGLVRVAFTGIGDVDFGPGPQPTNGGREDICLGTFSAEGVLVPGTDRCFGDDLPQYLVDFDADAAGNVALVGRTYSAIDFGLGPISCGGPPGFADGFLARFDASGTNTHASTHHGLRSVALRAGGLVMLTRDGFVSLDAKSHPTGAFIPEMNPADAAPPFFVARPDASGGIFAIGSIGGSWTVEFGGGPLFNSHPHQTSLLARVVLP